MFRYLQYHIFFCPACRATFTLPAESTGRGRRLKQAWLHGISSMLNQECQGHWQSLLPLSMFSAGESEGGYSIPRESNDKDML